MDTQEKNKAGRFSKGNSWKKRMIFISSLRGIRGVLLFLLFLSSCLVEERERIQSGVNGESAEITVQVKLPGITSAPTRALDESAEDKIQEIVALLFDPQTDEYLGMVSTTTIVDDPSDSRYKSFTLTLPQGTMDLVFLANARENIINVCFSAGIPRGSDKNDVLENLVLTHPGRWISDTNNSSYKLIPMWGKVDGITITEHTEFKDDSAIKLVRMLSKIDVELTSAAQTTFKLKEIYLYNHNTLGRLVPTGTNNWDDTEEKVLYPELIGGSSVLRGPIAYTQPGDITTANIASEGVIYTMEAVAGTKAGYLKNTCLVIGGEYGGHMNYYRIDFYSETDGYLPLLRNHRYHVRVTAIKGEGYARPEDAFTAGSFNIEADVLPWNDGGMTEIIFDDIHYLSLSKGSFEFSGSEYATGSESNRLSIETNWPEGWKIEKIVWDGGSQQKTSSNISQGWLDATLWQETTAGLKSTIQLLVKDNDTFYGREGSVFIRAGRLVYEVKVTQSSERQPELSITDLSGTDLSSLRFGATPASSQGFKVEWGPADMSLSIRVTSGGDGLFEYAPGSDVITDNSSITGGSKTYTILPPAMTEVDKYMHKSSRIDFTLSDGLGVNIQKSIVLEQVEYGMEIVDLKKFYVMDGGEHSFIVKSNAPWTATLTTSGGVVPTLVTTSGGNNPTGESVKFRTVNDISSPSIYEGKAYITFRSPQFSDVVVEIPTISGNKVGLSNCYIVKPGARAILIPVSRANQHAANAIGTTAALTTELLWTDNPNLIADNSNIRFVTETGTGSNGYVLVLPGSAEGNAVVAVKVGDQIKWSWHIWVMNDDPVSDHSNGSFRFMDRNLGALTKTQNLVTSFGLHYQWGRKDPFPGSSLAVSNYSPPPLPVYNATGATRVPDATPYPEPGNIMLDLTIAKPTTFYLGAPDNNYDWYSSTANTRNDNLWGGNGRAKTIYDPCPTGWRVPSTSNSYDIWGFLHESNFLVVEGGRLYNGSNFYPGAGYRNYLTDAISNLGSGSYWGSGMGGGSFGDPAYSHYFNFSKVALNTNAQMVRANGYSVRCVQE